MSPTIVLRIFLASVSVASRLAGSLCVFPWFGFGVMLVLVPETILIRDLSVCSPSLSVTNLEFCSGPTCLTFVWNRCLKLLSFANPLSFDASSIL